MSDLGNKNPFRAKLFAPSFWRSMSLLLAAIVHLACFVAILLNDAILLGLPWMGLFAWRLFFAAYCGIATGVVALAATQLRNFFRTFDEQEAKRKSEEGYETIQHSVN